MLFQKDLKSQNETLISLKQNDGFYDSIEHNVLVGMYKLTTHLNTKNIFQKHNGPYILYISYGEQYGQMYKYILPNINQCKG